MKNPESTKNAGGAKSACTMYVGMRFIQTSSIYQHASDASLHLSHALYPLAFICLLIACMRTAEHYLLPVVFDSAHACN